MRSCFPLLVLVSVFVALPAWAQHRPSTAASPPGEAFCELGSAATDLGFSDVLARLYDKGNLFYDNGYAHYEVPKGSGKVPVFAASIWVGGLVGGDLRLAAATYAQGSEDYEFWPGPLDEAGNPPADCEPYDRIWRVNVREVEHYEATGEAAPDLLQWPAALGAPWTDADGDGVYDLAAGDRPVIYGHETAWWVMNDAAGEHETTGSEPLHLEVRVTAFSVASAEAALHRATFYRYELEYEGEQPLEEARFTFWTDPDLGNHLDDYIGTDTTRGMAFVYNGDDEDEGASGYGVPPAVGFDLLGGAGATMYFNGINGVPTGEPNEPQEYYRYMQARWKDGLPLVECAAGRGCDGDPISFVYPGTVYPEPEFWSEPCPYPDCAAPIEPGDRRVHISTPAFTLEPGETKTVDLAILFAWGEDRFDSVGELLAASDAVQGRYDAGALFAPFPAPPSLPAPELLSPDDGEIFDWKAQPTLEWTAVPGADRYAVDHLRDGGTLTSIVQDTQTEPDVGDALPQGTTRTFTWRVRAEAEGEGEEAPAVGAYSDLRTYGLFRPGIGDGGDAIVEVASPAGPPCPDADDPGCEAWGGNTVWHDPNVNGDYYVNDDDDDLDALVAYPEVAGPHPYEIRFTEACAAFGACLGAYFLTDSTIVSVPFELWHLGEDGGPEDDTRLIPLFLRPASAESIVDWEDTFTGTDGWNGSPCPGGCPTTEPIWWMLPDRPGGYALFEEAADGFGGPGATYRPSADGDDEDGECSFGGYYADFCGGPQTLYAPIRGLVFADLAGDGTTPEPGTTVRFVFAETPAGVDAEDDAAQPEGQTLAAPYPNPGRGAVTVPFSVGRSGPVRLVVYDVLGREVAVLVDGAQPAGTHAATLDGRDLAAGVYLVVLEAEGERQSRRLTVLR